MLDRLKDAEELLNRIANDPALGALHADLRSEVELFRLGNAPVPAEGCAVMSGAHLDERTRYLYRRLEDSNSRKVASVGDGEVDEYESLLKEEDRRRRMQDDEFPSRVAAHEELMRRGYKLNAQLYEKPGQSSLWVVPQGGWVVKTIADPWHPSVSRMIQEIAVLAGESIEKTHDLYQDMIKNHGTEYADRVLKRTRDNRMSQVRDLVAPEDLPQRGELYIQMLGAEHIYFEGSGGRRSCSKVEEIDSLQCGPHDFSVLPPVGKPREWYETYRDILEGRLEHNPHSAQVESWSAELEKVNAVLGNTATTAHLRLPQEETPDTDMSGWTDARKTAYGLLAEHRKRCHEFLDGKKLAVFKRHVRAVAKTIPASDEAAVLLIDTVATRIWGAEYVPTFREIEFADAVAAETLPVASCKG